MARVTLTKRRAVWGGAGAGAGLKTNRKIVSNQVMTKATRHHHQKDYFSGETASEINYTETNIWGLPVKKMVAQHSSVRPPPRQKLPCDHPLLSVLTLNYEPLDTTLNVEAAQLLVLNTSH